MKTKRHLIFSLILLTLSPAPSALSQIPQGFSYQAVARNGSGSPVINTPLPVRITIQSDSLGGTIFWQELHSSVISNGSGVINLVIGKGVKQAGSAASFSDITWSVTPKFIKTEINYSGWKTMGSSRFWSVPYSLVAKDVTGPVRKLDINGTEASLDSALFEVKNKQGETIFAVYNEGVRVYVDNGAKGAKGGFAVGGFDMAKGTKQTFLAISDDSVKIYIDSNPLTKKPKGGFAVGGYDMAKGTVQNYIDVSADSIRMYIDKSTKSKKGGFAVGSFDMAKGGKDHFLDVATDASGIINPAQNRILWYPLKNAFLTGKVLIEAPDSVGTNSFASGYESKAIGKYSQAMGFMAKARGDYSTAIGDKSISIGRSSFAAGGGSLAYGYSSYAIGTRAKAYGDDATAFGYETFAIGACSFAMGTQTWASGQRAVAMGSGSAATGTCATALGWCTGAHASNSTAMGNFSKADGTESVAMGLATYALGNISTAMGKNTHANSFASLVIGQCNDTTYWPLNMRNAWKSSDPVFVIGNGNSTVDRRNAFVVLKNGNVGIGISTPETKFAISGLTATTSGYFMRIYNDNVYYYSSSAKTKTDIFPFHEDFYKILKAQPVSFTDKVSGEKNIGYIAEDFDSLGLKNLVIYKDGEPMSLSYELVSLYNLEIIKDQQKAIKEQQYQIESYKSENDNLKSQLQSLQEKVDKIEILMAKALDE